jgi:hypothetical protein
MADNNELLKALDTLRRSLLEHLAAQESKLVADETEVKAKVDQRKELAQALALNERLFRLYEEIRFYPNWARTHPDAVFPLVQNVVLVNESGDRDLANKTSGDRDTVNFEFHNHRYALKVRFSWQHIEKDSILFEYLSFTGERGHLLFEGQRSIEWDGVHHSYGDVLAFVPSNWVDEILELSERIEALKVARRLKGRQLSLESAQEKFGIGQHDVEVIQMASRFGVQLPTQGEPSKSVGARVAGGVVGKWWRALAGKRRQ